MARDAINVMSFYVVSFALLCIWLIKIEVAEMIPAAIALLRPARSEVFLLLSNVPKIKAVSQVVTASTSKCSQDICCCLLFEQHKRCQRAVIGIS